MSGVSKKNKESVIPNLEEIAISNLNFSDNSGLGGAQHIDGSSWTAAAMVSTTSGVPVQIPFGTNIFNKKISELNKQLTSSSSWKLTKIFRIINHK